MKELFVLCDKGNFSLETYSGFAHYFEQCGEELFALDENGRKKLMPSELNDDLIVLKGEDLLNFKDEKKHKKEFLFLNGTKLFVGSKGYLKNEYEHGEIRFSQDQILEETEFVHELYDIETYLKFVNGHSDKYQKKFANSAETYKNFIFARYYLIRFFYSLYGKRHLEPQHFFEEIDGQLSILSNDAGRNIRMRDADDYAYYIAHNPKMSFDKFKDITMAFLY